MGEFINLTGQRFGRWLVLKRAENTKGTRAVWLCRCDCGNTNIVTGKDLRNGKSKSCGCLRTKHGGDKTKLYYVWHDMKSRCFNKNSIPFKDYGGRGITVCDEWRDSFESFRDWSMANGYVEGLTIDRIDNDGPYSPENCRWVTQKLQCNNRRGNHIIEFKGESHTISEWSDMKGIPPATLRRRLSSHNWSVEKALETPVRQWSSHNIRKKDE